jgi:hypothetical protein
VTAPSVARRVVTPRQCAIAFGIPTSREGFLASRAGSAPSFARQFHGGWSQYEALFLADLHRVEPVLRRRGTHVAHDVTLDRFAALFADYPVVVLFSHWAGDAIEFSGGFASPDEIVASIPSSYVGVLDLCVCHPGALVAAVLRERPGCLVRWIEREALPHYWLRFYEVLMRRLNAGDVTYLDALEQVVGAFLDRASGAEKL